MYGFDLNLQTKQLSITGPIGQKTKFLSCQKYNELSSYKSPRPKKIQKKENIMFIKSEDGPIKVEYESDCVHWT